MIIIPIELTYPHRHELHANALEAQFVWSGIVCLLGVPADITDVRSIPGITSDCHLHDGEPPLPFRFGGMQDGHTHYNWL